MTTQRMDVGIIMSYPVGQSATKADLAGKPVQHLVPTVVTTGAAVWQQVATIAPGTLAPGKYAVSRVICYSATGKAFRLTHSDFQGLKPGGRIGYAICQKKNVFDFGDFDECPIFDASETLGIDLLTVSAETPVLAIEVVKVA